jgi:hypothetical protein
MKYTLLLFVLAITTTSCKNVHKTNVEVHSSEPLCLTDYSHTLDETDSIVIASLESDSCLYDPELIMKPIDDSTVQYFVLNHDAIDTIKNGLPDYLVVKYKLEKSYIVAYEGIERTRNVISFLFEDNGLTLLKGISIGDSLSKIKTLYNRNVLYGNIVSIIEESEMAEIKLFFRNDIIKRIMYVDYESCFEFDLLKQME